MMHNQASTTPRIVITMGEPAGIGPEIIIKAAQSEFDAQLILLADKRHIQSLAEKLGYEIELSHIDWQSEAVPHRQGHFWIEDHPCEKNVQAGILDPANARTTLDILHRASELALECKVQAIVTAPVHKSNLNQIAPEFLGHTEYFAQLAGVDRVVMMLATLQLRMTLATTHLPLSQVPAAITTESLRQTIEIILNSLNNFSERPVKMGVCGLNPHAGEDGLLGDEELRIISPLIQSMQKEGYNVTGPFPADTLFTPKKLPDFDVFLAMYHDQGLPVVKSAGFGQCANVTLGLPYIRTSVDHGTALDIAKDYQASGESLIFAVNYAIALANGKLPQ